ncbi:MAG: DUF302 domain-containing protein [Flavobacteriales bacterium]|mgnify:FL=1|jgi:uncharacterized protein (DUF302 family)|nr:DUF302 domain-containing protein [Flavobacteriales bacterium]MBK6884193.1 DUF302 domain-containing protein [Flavobacteriales bacterium]MBK7100573.1 DUF302 domain-containing protein [Flavobacteriales bacterium]MBK7111269.1 DUF302 domain-containing protein [Flavobacteriales bacterium]MBK7484370.1 DUF302 domain-containing protein [Flavobacteriales bacterium]
MNYAITRTIDNTDMAALKERTVEALKTEGFGVLTEIDLQATLKKKLNKDHLPHLILGACNPGFADQVVTLEPRISTMLPCNVTIRQLPDGSHEVAAIDPAAAMSAVKNPAIEPFAAQVRDALKRVIEKL